MQTQQSYEVLTLVELCKEINSSVSLGIIDLINRKDVKLLSLTIDPNDYSSSHAFANDYLVINLLSKFKGYVDWFPEVDTREAAITSWKASELKCKQTNNFLKSYGLNLYSDSDVGRIFRTAREKIYDILGYLDLPTILDGCKWTNGATADTKYGTPLGEKISKPISVTATGMPYFRACVESDPHWCACFLGRLPDGPVSLLHAFKIRDTNRFLTVPKNAKTDRTIAAEPAGNVFIQRGVGIYMRNRLNRYGIRLSDQSINQYMAQRAYKDKLATLDLKSASDTISIEIIRALLPSTWFEFLNDIRCKSTRFAGATQNLEKFSSMGNAFTFELESLIFYAIAYAVAMETGSSVKDVSVYGDDIICPQQMSNRLIDVLAFCGFDINISKSFLSGNFFESCGKHFYAGRDVSPIFQKEKVSNLQERIRFYNRIYRWGCRNSYSNAENDFGIAGPALRKLRKLFNINVLEVSNGRIPAIPRVVEGDDGFLVSNDWLTRYDINRGYYCSVYIYRAAAKETRAVDALLAYKLRNHSYSNVDPKGHQLESLKDKGVWRITKRFIHPWPSFYVEEISIDSDFTLI